ncbi:fibronectin type III domain-containing protein [Cellulophaga baltica 4]|nr:fibronectin type III domain-containing protein [Cellulophaga baltica 4]
MLHTGVSLSWISSSSTDVAKYQLFRKSTKASGIWELVFETKDTITHFKDTKLTAATKYAYAIKAVDESGLSSEDSPTITIKTASNTEDEVIKNLNAVVDRDHNTIRLYWRKLPDRIKELVIFKSKKMVNQLHGNNCPLLLQKL